MMKKLCLMLAIALSGFLASCGDNSDEPAKDIVKVSWPRSFNYVTSAGAPGGVIDAPSYTVEFENNSKTATLTMSNVRFSQDAASFNYVFSNVKWQADASAGVPARIINARGQRADNASSDVFDLQLVWCESVEIDGVKYQSFALEYTVNNSIHVTVMPYVTRYSGKSVTVNAAAGTSFESTSTGYTVTLRPAEMKADIVVSKAAFAANMPSLGDMLFPGVDLALDNGGFRLSNDAFIPSIGGTPYPRFQITGLNADCDLSAGMDLVFNCQQVFTVTAELGMPLVEVAE